MSPEFERFLKEIEAELPSMKWRLDRSSGGGVYYEGLGPTWDLVACSYEKSGRYKSTGYDASATNKKTGQLVKLTKDLAEKTFKRAESACRSSERKT